MNACDPHEPSPDLTLGLRIIEHPILSFEKGRRVRFFYDDRLLEGYEGEPIAAALHAAGVRIYGISPKLHRPRGFFCAMGHCSSCLMEVDGAPNVRICVEPLREGMRVKTQPPKNGLVEEE